MSTVIFRSAPDSRTSLCPGSYFTDGIRLYRVVTTLLDPWKGESVELEDCMTLRTSFYAPDALGQMDLAPVRPAAA
jgi:hypothetical protein